MIEVTVKQEAHYVGKEKTLAVIKLARVPMKGEYVIVKNRRYRVEDVEFLDSGKIIVTVS